MSDVSIVTTPEEQRELERFYFQEARLLDSRQFQQWLALVTPEVEYLMPSRVNTQVNNRDRGSEAMLSVERELEGLGEQGSPIREEGYIHLMLRVERAFKINSWSENPPPRTRRIVGNVELMASEGDTRQVLSNFHLHYARPGGVDFLYCGQRRDTLQQTEEGLRLRRREVILDYSDIEYPTLGLLF